MKQLFITLLIISAFTSVAIAYSPTTTQVISLDGTWLISKDPTNTGLTEHWQNTIREDAQNVRVPGVMQETLKFYYGIAWYWKEIDIPSYNDTAKYLRFWMVDYGAKVYINGNLVGEHEGSEEMFMLDITNNVKPGKNLIALRVHNMTRNPIDGIETAEVPHRGKWGGPFAYGGIIDSVELIIAPQVKITDMYLIPDYSNGNINIEATVNNIGAKTSGTITFAVTPDTVGETIDKVTKEYTVESGQKIIKATLTVPNFKLWSTQSPHLYRVSAISDFTNGKMTDTLSDHCGFRDFRYENGYFKLNGKIYLFAAITAMR